jgi:hypothetical protein
VLEEVTEVGCYGALPASGVQQRLLLHVAVSHYKMLKTSSGEGGIQDFVLPYSFFWFSSDLIVLSSCEGI